MSGRVDGAFALYRAGRYEETLAALADYAPEGDEYLDVAYLFGLCLVRLDRLEESLLYLEQVVTGGATPDRERQCRFALAYVYSLTGRSRLAEYEIGKIMDRDGESLASCLAMGYACWAQGRLDEGVEWYEKALAARPDNPTALNGLGFLLACSERDLNRALACCRKALDADPDNPAYLDSLGWACHKLGYRDEALRRLRDAARADPDSDDIRKHLETVLEADTR